MLPGVAVHVIHRGNNRSACFFEDEDRSFYLFHLARLLPRAGCELHAYCLMGNHLHLLLTARAAPGCALLMKSIAQLHAQYINKNYQRSGYLWESRFKSCLVQSEGYLLSCYRYIELNPVRAGLARRPDEYRWSSYAANGRGEPSSLITPHDQYVALGRDPGERQAAYREMFGSELGAPLVTEIRKATNGGYVFASHDFKKAVSLTLGRRVEKGAAGRPTRVDPTRDQLDLL